MKSKDKIVDSLIFLMDTNEFESIQVKDISKLAKVNRSTYYRNFKSKEDIIKYKLKEIMDEYINEYQSKENHSKEEYILTILETFYKYNNFFKVIYKAKQIHLLQGILIEYFHNNIKSSSKEELYQIYYHIGGIYNFTICWIENGMYDNPKSLAKIGAKITSNIDPYLWDKI